MVKIARATSARDFGGCLLKSLFRISRAYCKNRRSAKRRA